MSEVVTLVLPDPTETHDTAQQRIVLRLSALRQAVKWVRWPGARPSDVVAAAVWFEDFLFNGLNYEKPPDSQDDPVRGAPNLSDLPDLDKS